MIKNFTYPEYSKHYPLLVRNIMRRPLYNFPDDIAMIYRIGPDQYVRLTWRQWHERTSQLAHALKDLGVKQGDCIATMALNHHWHMEKFSRPSVQVPYLIPLICVSPGSI